MGLMSDIKNDVKRSGANKGKIMYFKSGVKVRVRFLQEIDDGLKIQFHDSFEAGINVPCQEIFDRDCKHHDDESLRHRDLYCWSVWDYEAKETKLLMGAVNNCSPIPSLIGMCETYESMTDRDYIITKNGSQTNTTYSVVPMDKVKFKNKAAKALSESKVLSILDKAYPEDSDEDEDEDETPRRNKKSKKVKAKSKAKYDEDEDEDDEEEEEEAPKKSKSKSKPKKRVEEEEEEDEEDEEEENEYEDLTPKELYALCKKRKIKVEPKKPEKYYIKKLEAADESDEDDEEDDENEW